MKIKIEGFSKCLDIESIADINKQFEYEDNNPRGERDSPLVSCGQTKGYNELQHIYDTKLSKYIDEQKITKKEALQALCMTCRELDNPRTRDKFYRALERKLGITIDD